MTTFDAARAADSVREFLTRQILRQPHAVIRDDDPLMTSGVIDSFALVDLLRFLEDTFQISVSESDLTADRMNTIRMIVQYVAAARRG